VPLVNEARDWQHGTFLGSIISSEKTAAAAGKVGELRRDPMAMLPFCGYNMADYWSHWLSIGRRAGAVLPKIYYVNWFRKSDGGDFLWPGFGDNSRVLKWVFERCEGTAKAIETPIGNLPADGALDLDGLEIDADDLAQLLRVDVDGWLHELPLIREYYAQFGDRMPKQLLAELDAMRERLEAAKS
jgi:phosphoenolpyruvate carboxykinase (GTP)